MKISTRQFLYLKKQARRLKRDRHFGEPLDRGSGEHRPKYVCLKCRLVIRVSRKGHNNQASACGRCGGYIFPVGPMFRPPPANTNRGKRAWEKIGKSISYRTRFYAVKQAGKR